jgi:ligand-binding sensor domain-containing protein
VKKSLATFVVFFLYAAAYSQQQYTFTNYTQEQGLPSGTIRGIYKDTTGYIWLTSEEGVSRFDGYDFKVFRHNPDVSSSLPTNSAWYGSFTKYGTIYFETEGRHCLYNPASESFTFNLPFGDTIRLFSVDESKGNKDCYWVKSKFAIFRISKSGTERFALPYPIEPENWVSIPAPDNRDMLFNRLTSKDNLLFFDYQTKRFSNIEIVGREGTEDNSTIEGVVFTGNNFYLFSRQSVYRFDSTAKSFLWLFDLKRDGNFEYASHSCLPFNDTLIMIRSKSGFLNILNIKTGEEKLVYVNKRIPDAELNDRTIVSCTPDNNGGVWMGTSEMGMIHYNVFTGELEQFIHEPGNSYSLPRNFVDAILPDENGVIWASCMGHGLIKMEPVTPIFKIAVPTITKSTGNSGHGWSESIRCFLETDDGYWMGTINGLFGYSAKTNLFSDLQHICPPVNSFSKLSSIQTDIVGISPVGSLAKDSTGNVWIGTWYHELIVYNPKLKRTFPLSIPQSIKERDKIGAFRNLYCDSKNRMWIATHGVGVSTVNCNVLNFEKINETKFEYNFFDAKDSTSGSSVTVFVVTEDTEGNIWAGTEDGLFRYNEQTKKWKSYYNIPGNENSIHNNNIRSMCLDKKGALWIGTNGEG